MDPIEALAAAKRTGRRVAQVTVVAVEGDVPSHPGAKLVADRDGILAGTLGCSEFDTEGLALAREVLDGPATARRAVALTGHERRRAIELFAEVAEPDPRVYVVGVNPLAAALVQVAAAIGRRVVVLSADPVEGPAPDTLVGPPPDVLRDHAPTGSDAVVVTDHDAPWVDDVLAAALPGPARFVGMLGSRRHAPAAVARLRARGLDERHIARLHSPCGLDIGSRTPGEIALSIVAEIVADERGAAGGTLGIDWSAAPPA